MDHTGTVGATGLLRLQSRGNVSTREFRPDRWSLIGVTDSLNGKSEKDLTRAATLPRKVLIISANRYTRAPGDTPIHCN